MINEQYLNENKKNRITLLKIIFTLMVVYVHARSNSDIVKFSDCQINLNLANWLVYLKYFVSVIISNCCNDGFFLVSSLLLYRNNFNWLENFIKKLKTLLIPYILFNTIYIIIYYIGRKLPVISKFFANSIYDISNYHINDWFVAYGLNAQHPICGVSWFLRNLFILNIFSVCIKKAIDYYPKLILILSFACYFTVDIKNCIVVENFSHICFFLWGYYLVKYKININILDNNKIIFVSYFVVVISLLIIRINECKDILFLIRLNNFISIIFLYSIITFKITDFMKEKLIDCSKYCFFIYITHHIILSFLQKVCLKYLPHNNNILAAEYVILPMLVCLFLIVIGSQIKKNIPNIFYVLSGFRKFK